MSLSWSLTKNALPDLADLIPEEALRACLAGAEASVEDMKAEISGQIGSGVQYPELPNRSSAPGEAPVDQLHELLESIQLGDGAALGAGEIGADAEVTSEVGLFLEMGTSKMGPRHFVGPAAITGEGAARVVLGETAEKIRAL